jgi:hypothetical protein
VIQALACTQRRKLPCGDVSEDEVLSGNAPAFVCADVFSGDGHSLPLDYYIAQAPEKAEHEHD